MTPNFPDLDAEFAASQKNLDGFSDDLIAMGVPRRVISIYGLVGAAPVRSILGGLFEFDPLGKLALIVPVRASADVDYPEDRDAETAALLGSIVDLVAFIPTRPRAFARRTGLGRFLGHAPRNGPSLIWENPWQWLCADCRGVVLLERNPSLICETVEGMRSGLVACSVEHGQQLRSALGECWTPPPIFIRSSVERADA